MAENTSVNTQVENPPVAAAAEAVTPAAEPQVHQIPDDALVEVIVGGQPVRKPWKDARSSIMMQEDYTRKTQGVSAQAREVRELFEALKEKEAQVNADRLAVDRLLGRVTPEKEAPLGEDDVPTVGAVKSLLKQVVSDVRREAVTTAEQATTAARFERWEGMVADASEKLVKDYPALADVPYLDDILKKEARKENPTDERSMVAAIIKAGRTLSEKLEKSFTERQKLAAKRQQELKEKGPEPVNRGTPQFRTPDKNYMRGKSNRKIDFDEIERDAIAAIEGAE